MYMVTEMCDGGTLEQYMKVSAPERFQCTRCSADAQKSLDVVTISTLTRASEGWHKGGR